VVLVSRVDEGLDRAMRYAERLDADQLVAIHSGNAQRTLGAQFWARYGRTLHFQAEGRGLVRSAQMWARAHRTAHDDGIVGIVVPEVVRGARWGLRRPRPGKALRVRASLLTDPGMTVVVPPTITTDAALIDRPLPHQVALVPTDTIDGTAPEVLQVASLLGRDEVRTVQTPDRADGAAVLVEQVRSARAAGADVVTVVLGERPRRWWRRWSFGARVRSLPRDAAVALVATSP
jgi:hypothetical protein